jgi:hypothetical protein
VEYEQFAETLHRDWLDGRLILSPELSPLISVEHCPEPFLRFGGQNNPMLFLTMNPGNGEEFQRKANVDTPMSPLRSHHTYAENARLLAARYSSPDSDISGTARLRIAAMLHLATVEFGMTGVLQVETMPFHSADMNITGNVRAIIERDPTMRAYTESLRSLIDMHQIVWTISAGQPPFKSNLKVRLLADRLGLDLAQARTHVLKSSASGRPSVVLLAGAGRRGVRAISIVNASNVLPRRESLRGVRRLLAA